VYAISELLDKEKKEVAPKLLHSAGAVLRYAAFVQKDKQAGLLLNEAGPEKVGKPARDPWPRGLLYDFGRGRLTAARPAAPTGWKLAGPAADGWSAAAVEGERAAVAVWHKGEKKGQVTLTARQVDALALLPPRQALPEPVLALAYRDEFQLPQLRLYNARTGEPVRQFTGHLAAITSLAFSADGRLLVSAAEDQTVCVWSLDG